MELEENEVKKQILITVSALAVSLGISGTALAAGWQETEEGWWYEREDKTYPVNNWFQDPASGKWYHFDANGYMQTGWIEDNGKQYYLDKESGAMWANAVTPDGWTVDSSGAWLESVGKKMPADTAKKNNTTTTTSPENKAGWREDGIGRWYQNSDGSYVKNRWKTINSSRYYFDEDGYATVGFAEIDGDEYYFSEKGVLKTKDFTLDGEVYIVNSKGVILDVVDEWDYENEDYDRPSSGSSKDNGNQSGSGQSGNGQSSSQNPDNQGSSQNGNSQGQNDTKADGLDRELAEQVVDLVNAEREKEGLNPLSINETLMECSETRSKELIEKFSHTRPDGTSCFSILDDQYEYSRVGENIAEGYTSPEHVMNGWMNSSGHRANILKSSFEEIGVGCYKKNGRKYWVQMFGTPR